MFGPKMKTDTVDVEQHPPSRGRGRSRFTVTPDIPQNESIKPADPTRRRISSRKRVTETTDRRTASRTTERSLVNTYEVEEIVNESPIDPFRRQSKPRVLTETHYEAANAPKRKLFDPTPINEAPEDLFKTIDKVASDTLVPETSSVQTETTHDVDVLDEFTDTTFKTNALDISSDTPKSNEITKDFTRSQIITTPKPVENRRFQNGARRNNFRTKTNSIEVSEEPATQASRSRVRTRPTRKPEESSTQAASRIAHRGLRRRMESSTQLAEASRKGPSVFAAEPVEDLSRSRTGRRIGGSTPEKLTFDLANSRNRDRKIIATPATTTTPTTTTHWTEEGSTKRSTSRFQSRNVETLHSSSLRVRSRSKDVKPIVNEFPLPTAPTKNRFRSREFPSFIDEQKLEVLPLFAVEPKTVRPVLKTRSRSRPRSVNLADETIQMSATENDLKFSKPNEIPSRVLVTRSQTINVETRTQTSVRRKQIPRKQQVKESVIAEVTEVTSKRTVSRRKNIEGKKDISGSTRIKTDKSKISVNQVLTNSRGKKKSDTNLNEINKKGKSGDSTEEIDETDNYPEPFKALIQAKKDKKESRSSPRPQFGFPTITTIVTSSTAPSIVVSSEVNKKEDDDLENELDPKPSTTPKSSIRVTRKRFSLTTKSDKRSTINKSTTATTPKRQTTVRKSSKVVRSTASPTSTLPSKEHRFHAKFSSTSSTRSENSSLKSGRNSTHPRGLYSSRKYKEDKSTNRERQSKGSAESSVISTQVPKSPSLKKSNLYSSKYRSDISSRGSASRSTTSAPAYIPTIPTAAYIPTVPTLTPPRTTVYSGTGTKDVDLGLEVISFDDPVNTVPSANLVNGEFISSTENALNLPVTLVNDGTTEKPVSIIERIINSITAISTTSPPDSLKQTSTVSTTESSSAILKLATKKSTKLDKTKTKQDETAQTYPIGTVTFTSEKPTTIIERILSSLSAIQATDDTNSNQVGKDFNTISSPQTTPVSRVIKSSASRTTLPAQISTSVNPLSVLDEISPEQVLQKRTIGKLLALLNGLVSSTEVAQKLVVVTPKTTNFGTSVNNKLESRSFVTTSTETSSSDATSTLAFTLPTTLPSSASTASLTTSITPTISVTTAAFPTISTAMPSTDFFTTMVSDIANPQLFTSSADDNISSTEADVTTLNSNSSEVESRLSEPRTGSELQVATIPSPISATQLPNTVDTFTSTTPIITRTPINMVASTVTSQTEVTMKTTVPSATTQISSGSLTNIQMNKIATSQAEKGSEQDNSEVGVLPLFLDPSISSSSVDSTTTTNTFPTTTEAGLTGTTDTDTLLTYFSTIPTLQNFEVDQNTIPSFEANPLSVDTASSTSNAPEASTTTITTTPQTTSDNTVSSTSSTTESSTITVAKIISSTKTNIAQGPASSAIIGSSISSIADSTMAPNSIPSTTINQITNAATTTQISTLLLNISASSTTPGSTTTQAPSSTLPTLSELLNGRTLEAFNSIINNTNTNTNTNVNYQTLQFNKSATSTEVPITTTQASPPIETTMPTVMLTTAPIETTTLVFTVTPAETTSKIPTTTKAPKPVPLSNRILESTSPQTSTNSLTAVLTTTPPTTQPTTTRRIPSTTPRLTTTPIETTLSLNPTTTVIPSRFPTDSFFPTFPTFITTLFPTLLRVTPEPPTTRSPSTTTQRELFTASASTTQPTTVIAPRRGRINFSEIKTTIVPITSRRKTTTDPPSSTITTRTTTVPSTTTTTSATTTVATTTTPVTTTTAITTTTISASTAATTTPAPATTTTRAPTTTTTRAPTTTTNRAPTTTTTIPPTTTRTTEPLTMPIGFASSTRRSVPITAPSTVVPVTSAVPVRSTTQKLKQLTEEQKKNLETLAELEKEQAAILEQLSFLTSLNFGGNRKEEFRDGGNLANKVIALAVERDKAKATTAKPVASIQDQLTAFDGEQQPKKSTPSIEEVLKQYNLSGLDISTPSSVSTYGKSNDALLAALLKEQGIAPSTPKSLADQIKQAGIFSDTTTKKPKPRKPATRPPGRLMQGLNWLLNALAPPSQAVTKKPTKPVKPRKPPVDQELLANSPTHITPVVTAAPKPLSPNTLSQDDIQKLIKQLEAVQTDPKNSDALDLTQIKSLQNLINTNEGVEVLTNSQNGATSRLTTTESSTTHKKQNKPERGLRSTTVLPTTVNNDLENIDDDEELVATTIKSRPSLPPLRLRPVPGVDDNSDPLIRGNLITAAVNVTRAISGFLGSALQGAAYSFQSLLGSGSRLVGDYAQGSSARPG